MARMPRDLRSCPQCGGQYWMSEGQRVCDYCERENVRQKIVEAELARIILA